jgi:hypothetical protein
VPPRAPRRDPGADDRAHARAPSARSAGAPPRSASTRGGTCPR